MGARDVLLGRRFGRVVAGEVVGKTKQNKYTVNCVCDCGTVFTAVEASLRSGHTTSCGCFKREVNSTNSRKDYTGLKVGRLTMIEDVGEGDYGRLWKCICDCGNTTVKVGSSVKFGQVRSCGCLQPEMVSLAKTTHGLSKSREYNAYNGMVARCTDTASVKFPIYGGRGITICDRWLESFENFYEDMGDKPPRLTLERMDVNKGYSKDNCMWDTPNEQAYNQRRRADNTSGRVGVSQHKGRWLARIWKDKRVYDLGLYVNYEDAVVAREAGEMELYGYLKDKE